MIGYIVKVSRVCGQRPGNSTRPRAWDGIPDYPMSTSSLYGGGADINAKDFTDPPDAANILPCNCN